MWKALVMTLALMFLGSSVIAHSERDIPLRVVNFAETNVWKVKHEIMGISHGSGFWVNDTTMITACHVVNGQDVVFATNWDRTKGTPLDVLICNYKKDWALLKINVNDAPIDGVLEPIVSHVPKPGTSVITIGYPGDAPLYMTWGHYQRKKNGLHYYTAPTVGGNSGGPLVTYDPHTDELRIIGIAARVWGVRPSPFSAPILMPHMAMMEDLDLFLKDKDKYLDRNYSGQTINQEGQSG